MAMNIVPHSRQLDDLSSELRHRVDRCEISVEEANLIWKRAQYDSEHGLGGRYSHVDLTADPFGVGRRVTAQPATPPFDPNTVESLNVDLETLAGIWVAKYGTKWVKDAVFAAAGGEVDVFWYHAFARLRQHNKFESYANWSKLKEVPNGYV